MFGSFKEKGLYLTQYPKGLVKHGWMQPSHLEESSDKDATKQRGELQINTMKEVFWILLNGNRNTSSVGASKQEQKPF